MDANAARDLHRFVKLPIDSCLVENGRENHTTFFFMIYILESYKTGGMFSPSWFLAQDLVWLECPTKNDKTDEVELKKLPMLDPHEYLNYLWHHEHLKIEDCELQRLGSMMNNFRCALTTAFVPASFLGRLRIPNPDQIEEVLEPLPAAQCGMGEHSSGK